MQESAPMPSSSGKSLFSLKRLLLLGVAAGVLFAGAEFGTQIMVKETKRFLDEVLIRESVRNKIVFTYDAVERAGLFTTKIVNPRFVATTLDGEPVTFVTAQALISPGGWKTARVVVPEELQVNSMQGRLLVLGNGPLHARVGTELVGGLPADISVQLPKRTIVRVINAQNQRVGSYAADASSLKLGVERQSEEQVKIWLDGKTVAFGKEEAAYPAVKFTVFDIAGGMNQKSEMHYDFIQGLTAKGIEIHIPEDQGVPAGTFSAKMDLGWDAETRVQTFYHVQEGEVAAPPTLQYLIENLKLRDGYLNIASLPLMKFRGDMSATKEKPEPTGEFAVVVGGISSLKTLLNISGDRQGKTYLAVLESVEAALEKLGKRLSKDAIEIVFSRKDGEQLKLGAVEYQMGVTQLVEAAMRGTGVNAYLEAPGIGAAGVGDVSNAQQELPHTPFVSPIPEAATPAPAQEKAPVSAPAVAPAK